MHPEAPPALGSAGGTVWKINTNESLCVYVLWDFVVIKLSKLSCHMSRVCFILLSSGSASDTTGGLSSMWARYANSLPALSPCSYTLCLQKKTRCFAFSMHSCVTRRVCSFTLSRFSRDGLELYASSNSRGLSEVCWSIVLDSLFSLFYSGGQNSTSMVFKIIPVCVKCRRPLCPFQKERVVPWQWSHGPKEGIASKGLVATAWQERLSAKMPSASTESGLTGSWEQILSP